MLYSVLTPIDLFTLDAIELIYIPVRSNHHPLFKYQNP